MLGDVVELAVAPQRVRLLADLQLALGHAQRHDRVDGDADDGGHRHVPADDEEHAVAVEGAPGVGHREEEVAEVSSTLRRTLDRLCRIIIVYQGTLPATTPITIKMLILYVCSWFVLVDFFDHFLLGM
jgi:hypothetical protein